MNVLVGLLALLGGAALFVRLLRAGGRFALHAAEAAAASGRADAGARRGDVTAIIDGRATLEREQGAMRRWALIGALFLLWFAVPLALGVAAQAWALAAPLWLLRGGPLRPEGRAGRGTPRATAPPHPTRRPERGRSE